MQEEFTAALGVKRVLACGCGVGAGRSECWLNYTGNEPNAPNCLKWLMVNFMFHKA